MEDRLVIDILWDFVAEKFEIFSALPSYEYRPGPGLLPSGNFKRYFSLLFAYLKLADLRLFDKKVEPAIFS